MKYGVQLYTLRKYLKQESDVLPVFERVKAMGAEVVQISDMCEIDSKKLANISKATDLPICITHVPYKDVKSDLDRIAEQHLDFGCKNIGIAMMPIEYSRKSASDVSRFAEFLNQTSLRLASYGMTIAYHNHWFEFDLIDGKSIFDRLIDETSTEVQFIPDTYWIKVGGCEPQEFLKKLAGRMNTLHLKDWKKTLGIPLFKAIGEGKLNFPEILRVAIDGGAENSVVELDVAKKPYDSLERSLQYLRSIKEHI